MTHLLGSQVLSNTQLTKAGAPATVATQQRDKQKTPAHCWKVVHDADLDQVPETFRGRMQVPGTIRFSPTNLGQRKGKSVMGSGYQE